MTAWLISLSFVSLIVLNAIQSHSHIQVTLPNGRSVHYTSMNQSEERVVEIFFWYGCPHCLSLEKRLLEKDVRSKVASSNYKFRMTPLPANPKWESHARLYYALEYLGLDQDDHASIMSLIQSEKPSSLNEIFPQLETIIRQSNSVKETAEITVDQINRIIESKAMDDKIQDAKLRAKDFSVSGVPTVIIDGNKKVLMTLGTTHDDVVDIILNLIEK